LVERIYPTIKKILVRIQATISLWRWVRKIGFVYKRTSKFVAPLDTPTLMAVRMRYFAAIDELRNNGSKIFWHDETWCNKNEERRFAWTDGTTSIGRMRHSQNKDIHYSVLLNESDFHKKIIDISFHIDIDSCIQSTWTRRNGAPGKCIRNEHCNFITYSHFLQTSLFSC
jgi:hypothetical protein